MIKFSKLTNTKPPYYLYVTEYLFCKDMVQLIEKDFGLVNKFCLCTSVDSGSYGFPELADRYGSFTGFKINSHHLENWPTYSDFYDEWYVFGDTREIADNIDALCNWGCDYSEYEVLSDCLPNSCKMNEYINQYMPDLIFGCNDKFGYIFSSIKLPSAQLIKDCL